jgi:hypothetical protein
MAHQNTDSTAAASQNAASDRQVPNDRAVEEHVSVRPEPKSYAAPDWRDASLAGPAAGEIATYDDEGDAIDPSLGGSQQGRTHNDREGHAQHLGQGPKTVAANRRIAKTGAADKGRP